MSIDDKISHSGRGIVSLPIGGRDRTLRFRAWELRQLELRMSKETGQRVTILQLLSEQQFGFSFLINALIVGVGHEYVGKRRRDPLTEKDVADWVDACEADGITFEDLLGAIIEAIVSGMPNGDRLMADVDDDDDKAEKKDGDKGNEEGQEETGQAGTSG